MLDPIVNFVTKVFQLIGRGIGFLIGIILWPFMWAGRWYNQRGWTLKAVLGAVLIVIVGLYAYFFYVTQWWTNFNPDYPNALAAETSKTLAGDPVVPNVANSTSTTSQASSAATTTAQASQSCKPSAIAAISADLIDFNVNQNAWISSMVISKIGLFGIEWRRTPFFDNKAAFQLGINQVMRRTTTELVDTLGRVRGTSQIDQNLQDARTALAWNEDAWYVGWRGPTRPTPSVYREAIGKLRGFNSSLEKCQATFDARADNLMQFLDRIAGDIGSTSDILRARIEASDAGWFDLRADDRFWFAYGQLYAYYGVLVAARSDFAAIIAERNLTALWTRMEQQLRNSLDVQPWIISNGNESSAFFPSHLATMGFNLLQVRSNIVELRSVLDR
jgi:hypothetical protein